MTPDDLRRLAVVETEVSNIKGQLDRIEHDTSQLAAQANRWKGAIIVLLGVGGLIGWLVDKLPVPWGK